MNTSALLFGLLPLMMFVVIDSFAGVRAGVVSAMLFALGEAIYTYYVYGTLDAITMATLVLVGIFAGMAYRSSNALIFKLQPVVLGWLFAIAFLIMQALGRPLLIVLFDKYQYAIPDAMQERLHDPLMQPLMIKSSLYLGFGFAAHATVVAYAAFRLSKWWWLVLRGFGLYIMMFMAMFAARISLVAN